MTIGTPATGGPRARVEVEAKPLWRLRAPRDVPRYLLGAMAVAGLLASVRFALAPPRPAATAPVSRAPAPPDRAAEAFADLFARRYLTWNGSRPEDSSRSLAEFFGPGVEPGGGLQLPSAGTQTVDWAEVAQAAEPEPGMHVYTVAAQTDTAGLVYLAVRVARTRSGSLALAGYPAIVGVPPIATSVAQRAHPEVEDASLVAVVQRALRNYLAGSPEELAADLTSGMRVSTPAQHLSLESMQRPYWVRGGVVLAVLQARDPRGLQLTLAYELGVTRRQGRWEISAVQAGAGR